MDILDGDNLRRGHSMSSGLIGYFCKAHYSPSQKKKYQICQRIAHGTRNLEKGDLVQCCAKNTIAILRIRNQYLRH